jgi:hypothetical protein
MQHILENAARERLANICARLGSDFEGERAAAALLATKLLKKHGATWSSALTAPEPKIIYRDRDPVAAYLGVLKHIGDGWDALSVIARYPEVQKTAWVRKFVADLAQLQKRQSRLSPKQRDTIRGLLEQVRAFIAETGCLRGARGAKND